MSAALRTGLAPAGRPGTGAAGAPAAPSPVQGEPGLTDTTDTTDTPGIEPSPGPITAVAGRHLPALDGLRAVAVAGVLAYHLGFGWASGGYLGVDLFFVLSGFLITSLLVEEWASHGRVRLGAFWARRARRLLPALFTVLVAVGAFVVVMGRWGPPGWAAQVDLSGLRGDALATLLYVANWHAIFAHQSYFAQYSAPSPLEHTWSLAIEEQFYLVWPLVLLGGLGLWRRLANHGEAWRRYGVVVTLAAAIGSAALMAALYHPGADPTRVYYGTDTRMFDLLVGAALALVVASRPQPGPRARRALHVAAPVAATALGICWVVGGTGAGVPRGWMFEGGFFVCAVLAAVVVADARLVERGPLGAALAVAPLRLVGVLSYGIYLWHWPIFVFFDPATTGLSGAALDAARVSCTLFMASASYVLVERPLRRRRLSAWRRVLAAPLAGMVTAAVVVVATVPAVAVAPVSPATVSAAVSRAVPAPGEPVSGSGGVVGDRLAVGPIAPAQPVRVTMLGDSVARAAEPAIAASLDATGEVRVTNATIDGFGLTTDPIWRTSLPDIVRQSRAQVVLATWSWDDTCGPGSATSLAQRASDVCALEQPVAYRAMLASAVRAMLEAGAKAVVFLQFPPTGPVSGASAAARHDDDVQRAAGEAAWNRAARSLTREFPGRVQYLPVAASVLLDGHFSTWLPPVDDAGAPRGQWIRVRTTDGVHLCPAGAGRYADAVLSDLTAELGLRPAGPDWASGGWATSAVYDTPPGSCPADHPPG